jgi:hypothetical protein
MPRYLTALILVAALGAGGCSSSDTTTTTPTTPSLGPLTDTFTGTLIVNGAQSFPFAVTAGGTVAATVVSVQPDVTLVIGLSLGTWNGANCAIVLSNDSATQGSTITGTASNAGNLCVRIYDVGHVTAASPAAYTVAVSHP